MKDAQGRPLFRRSQVAKQQLAKLQLELAEASSRRFGARLQAKKLPEPKAEPLPEVLALRAERERLEMELQKLLRGRRQGLSTVSLPFAQACEVPFFIMALYYRILIISFIIVSFNPIHDIIRHTSHKGTV